MNALNDHEGKATATGRLEKIAVIHVGLLAIFSMWAFGGNAGWARTVIMIATVFAPVLSLWFIAHSYQPLREGRRMGRFLWPLFLFASFVIAGCFNPSFRPIAFDQDTLFIQQAPRFNWLPSTVNPGHTLNALWFFAGIYWSCLNLLLIVRQRRALRVLLVGLGINVVGLAIFGTLQKLDGSTGFYFGRLWSPQPAFFATFIYHNHWGAHAVLMAGAMLGLIFRQWKRQAARDFFHSPLPGGVLALLLLAASIPLSSSRSCTVLIVVLLLIAFVHAMKKLTAASHAGRSVRVGLFLVAVLVSAGAIYQLGRPVIDARMGNTIEQVNVARQAGQADSRLVLYRDTWRMAEARPAFGWGMGSYALIFQKIYNSQTAIDHLPLIYLDAHSDWLQALAELGFVGVFLIALTGLVPLAQLSARHLRSPLIAYLLGGCTLVLLYAWVEFPFANGSVVIAFWLCLFTAVHDSRLRDRAGSSS